MRGRDWASGSQGAILGHGILVKELSEYAELHSKNNTEETAGEARAGEKMTLRRVPGVRES